MKLSRSSVFLPLLFIFVSLSAEELPKAPNFVLNDTNNTKVVLTGLQGKVVFIDFWASWCAPCRNSIPEVESLFNKYKGKDIEFLGINLENDPKRVKEFIKIHKINYKILIGDQKVARDYKIRGIPRFIILNHKGEIFKNYVGFDISMVYQWEKSIKTLLKQVPQKKVIKKTKKKKYKKKKYKRKRRKYRKKK